MTAGPVNSRFCPFTTALRNPHGGVAVETRCASSWWILRDDYRGPPAHTAIHARMESALAEGSGRIVEPHADYVRDCH